MTLIDEAAKVRKNAYAPYSNFKVGAAIKTKSGAVYVGCNVENIAYPEGTCAEAGALAAMIAAGDTSFSEVAVIAESPQPVPPCGGCRQKLVEFADDGARITMSTTSGAKIEMAVADLLPGAFGSAHMNTA